MANFYSPSFSEYTMIGMMSTIVVWTLMGVLCGRVYLSYRWSTEDAEAELEAAAKSSTPAATTMDRKARARLMEKEEAERRGDKKAVAPASEEDEEEEEEEESTGDDSDSGEEMSSDDDEGYTSDELEEMRLKMVLIVRKDAPLTPQDIAIHASSAAIGVIANTYKAHSSRPDDHDAQRWWKWYLWWSRIGVAKITLRCNDATEFKRLESVAAEHQLPYFVAGDLSVLGVGPAPSKDLDVVSGALKLLS